MSLHDKPAYNHDALKEALAKHGLPVDTPSQNADSFRLGWTAAIRIGWSAAIFALPGMVKPLEFWESDTGDLCCDSMIGRYQIQKGGVRWCCMYAMGNKRRPKGDDSPTWHKSEEAAIAAAQAHHVAQIIASFGIDTPAPSRVAEVKE